jgi:HEAT repeat protein
VDPFRACEVQGEAGALLGSLLKHADREVRTAAIYCLGARQRGKPEDEDTKKLARRLNLLLDDREEQIRTAAAAVLSDIGPAGVEVVTDRWTPPDRPDLRHRSEFHGFEKISPYELWTLAQGGPAALPAAAAVIRDMGHEHSPLSPFVLAEMGTEAAPVLLKEWNGYDSERQFAIEAWGTDALPVYVDAMGSKNWYRAVSAVALLGEKGAPAIPTLTSWLSDRQLRGEAVDKLRGFGPLAKEAISALEKIETDDEREQREIAATLYCLEPTPQRFAACEKFLAPGLDRKADSEKQRFARDMWHLLKPPPVSLQLEILEKAWDGDIRDRTVFALKQHPELLRPVPPKLLELLRHEKDYVRRAAANVISRIGEAAVQAAPDLIQMTKAPKYEERVAAIDALGAVGAFGWKTEAVGALEACLADGEGSEKRIAAYSLRKIEIESRRLKNPTEKLPEPKEPSLEETLAYLNSDDGPKQEFGDEDVVPSAMSAPPFDLENWKKEFNSARETWHDYDSRITLKRLVHEAALTGKSAAGAVPYLWSLVRQEENRPLRQAALYALWRITQSRLVAYAMIQNNDLVLPIAAETIEQDLLLVPVLISSANYRGLFTLPLSEKAKRAATPFLSGNLDNGWSCAVLWHFYRDPEMLRELEQQLDWQTSISERGGRVVWALGYIGPAAREDVPRLARVAFWNNSPPVSRAASKALWRIDGKGAEDWRLPF